MEDDSPEPWLRGPLAGVPAHLQPVFFSFAQVREELFKHMAGVDHDQVWKPVAGTNTLGFHLKHLAGSINRLVTYLSGGQLTRAQIEFLSDEHKADAGLADLLIAVEQAMEAARTRLLEVGPETLFEARAVGRKQLPTTVLGLLVHISEHTQRHLGQAVLISKLLRQS